MGVRVAMLLGKVAILLALIVTIFLTFGQCKRKYSHYMVETEDKTGDNKGNGDVTHIHNDHDTNKKLLSHQNSNKKSKHEKMKLKKQKNGRNGEDYFDLAMIGQGLGLLQTVMGLFGGR